ncbi:cupin domain-containing protein [Beduinella massiliensis]|uniref:cupin domain-containing protein n=1 Tax=Beduinella massiliensis TaxID=1852363 RepID=UPI000C834534
MKIMNAWEEPGVTVAAPYQRNIKVLFAPDRNDVPELTFSHAIIYPHQQTDYHRHDRPELIYVVSGRGVSLCEGAETPVQADTALWIEAGEMHQMINLGDETMKLATVFIPAYTAEENYARCCKAAEAAAK